MGRHSSFNDDIAKKICDSMASGLSLRKTLELPGMPNISTVMDWQNKYPDFAAQYAHAREQMGDKWADEIMEISDNHTNDTCTKTSKKGEEFDAANHEWINRARLRVDSRKWLLSKLFPKKYGEKVQTEVSGDLTINVILERKKAPEK